MDIIFESLYESHFPLLLKWLQAPHVKKWWDQEIDYTLDIIQNKYGDYTKGYKQIDGEKKSIQAYIILAQEPIGYIQIYNAHDFYDLVHMPQNLGAFDIFIGNEKYLYKNIDPQAIIKFLDFYGKNYSYILACPDLKNYIAIKACKKAGFQEIYGLESIIQSKKAMLKKIKDLNFNI